MEPHWTTLGMFWATIAVCFVTVAATAINYFLFRSQTDPEVVVYTNHNLKRPTIITLVIKNIGKGVAHDVKFQFSEEVPCNAFGRKEIKKDKIEWVKHGPLVSTLPLKV